AAAPNRGGTDPDSATSARTRWSPWILGLGRREQSSAGPRLLELPPAQSLFQPAGKRRGRKLMDRCHRLPVQRLSHGGLPTRMTMVDQGSHDDRVLGGLAPLVNQLVNLDERAGARNWQRAAEATTLDLHRQRVFRVPLVELDLEAVALAGEHHVPAA